MKNLQEFSEDRHIVLPLYFWQFLLQIMVPFSFSSVSSGNQLCSGFQMSLKSLRSSEIAKDHILLSWLAPFILVISLVWFQINFWDIFALWQDSCKPMQTMSMVSQGSLFVAVSFYGLWTLHLCPRYFINLWKFILFNFILNISA